MQTTWTLTLTPPGEPASVRGGLSHDELFDILDAMLEGVAPASVLAPHARLDRLAA